MYVAEQQAIKVGFGAPANLCWLRYAQSHPDNPFVPRVDWLMVEGGIFVASVEKLTALQAMAWSEADGGVLAALDLVRPVSRVAVASVLGIRTREAFLGYAALPREEQLRRFHALRDPGDPGYVAMKAVIDFTADGHVIDLLPDHPINWMLRGNQLVINDPLA